MSIQYDRERRNEAEKDAKNKKKQDRKKAAEAQKAGADDEAGEEDEAPGPTGARAGERRLASRGEGYVEDDHELKMFLKDAPKKKKINAKSYGG